MAEKTVVACIRSCLVSTKETLSLKQLERDYYTIMGQRIPYGKLGYRSLEEFIESTDSLSTRRKNGEIFVIPKISEKSAHISELVHNQKTAKKKVSFRKQNTTRYVPPRMAQTTRWRPKALERDARNYQRSQRPAAVSHNQFVNKPSVQSRIVIPVTSALYRPENNSSSQNDRLKSQEVSSRLNPGPIEVAVKALKSLNMSHKGACNGSNNVQTSHIEEAPSVSSTEVNSRRKMIAKKMSESMNDRDSGNSSPTELAVNNEVNTFPIIPKLPERTGDPKKDLENFVKFHNLDKPEYGNKLIKLKKHSFWSCKLKVGQYSYGSYPKEHRNPIDAEHDCAEAALNDLTTKLNKNRQMLLTNDKDILERVPPMLEKHFHGIWDWQLRLDYLDKYNEELPADWLKIIDKSPCVQLEKCLPHNYIVRHCKPEDVLQKNLKRNTTMTLSDVSVPANTVHFGTDGKLYAEITCIMSANEIWCRQAGTHDSKAYNDMMSRMEFYYNNYGEKLKIQTVTIGGYYATKYENIWYRVRAIQEENSEVLCFFIDDGDELAVQKCDLYQLKREYASACAQAFVCRLVGLEDLYETSQHSDNLQKNLYKLVSIELATEAKNIDEDLSLPVYMYDAETGKSLNEELICILSVESATPALVQDTINEVYISHIESNGDVYVYIESTGYKNLQKLIKKVEEDIMLNPPTDLIVPITRNGSAGKLFFAKHEADGHWYRIQIIDWSPCETLAQIYFVDFGNTDVIKVNKDILYPLATLSDVLNLYPFQAVKVKMILNDIPDDFVELAKKAMPQDQTVLLKIIAYDEIGIPQVEFFKRNSDGGLFCINKSISIETEMKRKEDSNNNIKKRSRHSFDKKQNVPSSGKLQPPELPEKGDYFEVHVPLAVNPYNFFVQPLQTNKELSHMMSQIQERYKDVLYSPLTADQVVPGNIYASKHDDGNWYRTSVIKVINPGSISVFYCDFGYYANLTVQQLIPLDIEFTLLPYQALKAKIANIKPKQSQWTMDDCDNFAKMVEKKNFYSILKEIERDELYEEDLVLSLILIDTSSSEDVVIGTELIRKDVAVAHTS